MEIINAAKDLFLEKGFEATSIRMIQERVGKQVAVFYYYFESKDQVFDEAMKLFLKDYREGMEQIVSEERISPVEDLRRFLEFIQERSRKAREQYEHKLHWSVIGAIRSKIIGLMKENILHILNYYAEKGILHSLTMDVSSISRVLAYTFGGTILYEEPAEYESRREQLFHLVPVLLGEA